MKKTLTVTIAALLAGAAFALIIGKTDFAAEWKSLTDEYQKEYMAWLKPMLDAKSDEERTKVKLDESKNPAKKYLGLAWEFQKKVAGKPEEASALNWIAAMASQNGQLDESKKAIDLVIKNHADSKEIPMFCFTLQYGTWSFGRSYCLKQLQKLLARTKVPANKAQAMLAHAQVLSTGDGGKPATKADKAKATAMLKRVRSEYPTTDAGKRAEGSLFILERLQIGMVAPDFEIADENGKNWKLSDYRGKVVVIDFWGYW